jgi:integrase/recombinase XerD
MFRLHLRDCPYRPKGRRHWTCSCPIHLDTRINGRRVQKALGTTDWELGQKLSAILIEAENAISRPKVGTPPAQNEAISVDGAWENFLVRVKARNLKKQTVDKYELLFRKMKLFAQRKGLRFLKDFNLDILEQWQSEWKESPITRLKQLERLKAFFRAAHIRRWIDENPALAMRGPKINLGPTLPFSREGMASILEAIDRYPDKSRKIGRPNSLRLRAFVLVMRYSGLRIGDVTSLQPERLDGNKLFLFTQKTGVPVYVVLPEFVAKALRLAPRLSERYYFWTGKSTLHTAIGIWQRTLSNLFELAGIVGGHAHRFRDTFATELLLNGVPIEQVSVLLGHSSIRITETHYRPWVRDRQRQLELSLEKAWSQDPIVMLETNAEQKSSTEKRSIN